MTFPFKPVIFFSKCEWDIWLSWMYFKSPYKGYSNSSVGLWFLSCHVRSFLMRHNLSPYPCTREVIIIFFVHKSFSRIHIKGLTLRRRAAFPHEIDITARRGSSLYPWETENPFIGSAQEPDWRKWIIGNWSVPPVIMLQHCYRTQPQRWDGMGAGCFFYTKVLVLFPLYLST